MSWLEARDTALFIDDGALNRVVKAQPMLDFFRTESHLNMRQIIEWLTGIESGLLNEGGEWRPHDASPGSGIFLRVRSSFRTAFRSLGGTGRDASGSSTSRMDGSVLIRFALAG